MVCSLTSCPKVGTDNAQNYWQNSVKSAPSVVYVRQYELEEISEIFIGFVCQP